MLHLGGSVKSRRESSSFGSRLQLRANFTAQIKRLDQGSPVTLLQKLSLCFRIKLGVFRSHELGRTKLTRDIDDVILIMIFEDGFVTPIVVESMGRLEVEGGGVVENEVLVFVVLVFRLLAKVVHQTHHSKIGVEQIEEVKTVSQANVQPMAVHSQPEQVRLSLSSQAANQRWRLWVAVVRLVASLRRCVAPGYDSVLLIGVSPESAVD